MLATGVVALLLVLLPATWPRVRLGITIAHEAGHALVAVLVGRRLSRSGCTPTPPGSP